MKPFSSLSIRDKLIRVIVLITAAVLLPSALFLVVFDFSLLRQVNSRNLAILGEAIAYSSTAALAFEDRDDANRVLQSLRAEPDIIEAVLFQPDGSPFAAYPPELDANRTLPDIPVNEAFFSEWTLSYLIPVQEGETLMGWLFIHYDLSGLRRTLLFHIMVTASLSAVALFAAYFLSTVFQGMISKPVLTLENLARKVSEKHDYSLRAQKTTEDEIGSLTEAFNEMLDQIAAKEAALRISEERMRIAVEASDLGVWDWDLTTGSASWVGPIYQSFGLRAAVTQQSTSPFFDAIHQEDRPAFERAVTVARERGGVFEADFRVLSPDGKARHIRSRGRTFQDARGTPVRMVGVIIDVTDLRLAEAEIRTLNRTLEERVVERTAELQRALKEIEAFNYSVSHDLRTPLRGINGFSIALLEDFHDQLNDTGRDYLHRIVASCKRMSQLIDDLLELSRVTRHEMQQQEVNLSKLAAETLRSLQSADPDRQVEFQIEPDLVVKGDPGLLGIALDNLIQNAWKFTSRKKKARIEIGSLIEDGRRVFFVRDNGAGFDMAFSDKLFGVFHRLHKSNEFEGTGIGLATVRRIVERHRGEVWATGELDRGAIFYFTVGLT